MTRSLRWSCTNWRRTVPRNADNQIASTITRSRESTLNRWMVQWYSKSMYRENRPSWSNSLRKSTSTSTWFTCSAVSAFGSVSQCCRYHRSNISRSQVIQEREEQLTTAKSNRNSRHSSIASVASTTRVPIVSRRVSCSLHVNANSERDRVKRRGAETSPKPIFVWTTTRTHTCLALLLHLISLRIVHSSRSIINDYLRPIRRPA